MNSRRGRGRDASYLAPPAQIRTCSFPAYGSDLGSKRQMLAACAPAPVTRLPGSESGACFAGSHFPWSPPLAPPTPQRIAPPCSPASQLLWRSPTSRTRASSLHFCEARGSPWTRKICGTAWPLKSKAAQGGQASAPLPLPHCPHTRKELLLTSAMQHALQHALEAIDLERLPQGRPVAIGLGQLAIARGKDERRAAGNEGIGNRRGGLAFEIGVEDRNVEVGVLRRFQRLMRAASSPSSRTPMHGSGRCRSLLLHLAPPTPCRSGLWGLCAACKNSCDIPESQPDALRSLTRKFF